MRTLLSWLDYLIFERGGFSIQMPPNSTSNILRANEVERLGTLPEGDGEQSGLYWIRAPQTDPASSFFLS